MLPAAQVLGHPAVYLCGGGWAFFVAENCVLSENRQFFIDRLGERGYKSCYGLLSTASLTSVAYGLWRHGPGPRLRTVGPASFVLGSALTCVGLVGALNLAPALANPLGPDFMGCPLDLKVIRAEKSKDVVGLERVTRHPQFWSLGFLGLGCAAMTPFAGSAAAALGFPLVALINGAHLDSRHRRGMGGSLTKEREAKSSGVPFVALLQNRQAWAPLLDELKPVNSALALVGSAAAVAAFVAA